VAAVDREMSTIRESGKVRARERIAVLAALNIAYQLAEQGAARPSGGAGVGAPSMSPADLDALVARVDEALGDDGQLL
ncbi:MAG: cell division protein ZapA, partial [Rubrivivax sp.]